MSDSPLLNKRAITAAQIVVHRANDASHVKGGMMSQEAQRAGREACAAFVAAQDRSQLAAFVLLELREGTDTLTGMDAIRAVIDALLGSNQPTEVPS